MSLEVSFTPEALEWLRRKDEPEIVIDLTYKRGRCTSAFCTTIPNIKVYAGRKDGRYTFEEVSSREGRAVYVARPLVAKGEERDIKAIIYQRRLGGLAVHGVDPYELNL